MAGLPCHGRLVHAPHGPTGGTPVPRRGRPFFAVRGKAQAGRRQGSPSISPAERGAGQDAGDT